MTGHTGDPCPLEAMARVVVEGHSPHFPAGTAVVIGGSGGIGRVVCERLADHGSDVALTYRTNRAAATAAATAVEATGRRAFAASLDLSDAAAVGSFFGDVVERFGRIHTVIFAVGGDIPLIYAAAVTPTQWRDAVDGELTGFFHVVKAAVPLLREQGGSIVALTSAGLVRHPPMDVLSTVPKAGVEALVRAVAREEGRFGVRANSVALGVVDAGLFQRIEQRVDSGIIEAMKWNTALRRLGTAREAADAIVFLASSVSGFITGHSLTVDGGFSV